MNSSHFTRKGNKSCWPWLQSQSSSVKVVELHLLTACPKARSDGAIEFVEITSVWPKITGLRTASPAISVANRERGCGSEEFENGMLFSFELTLLGG